MRVSVCVCMCGEESAPFLQVRCKGFEDSLSLSVGSAAEYCWGARERTNSIFTALLLFHAYCGGVVGVWICCSSLSLGSFTHLKKITIYVFDLQFVFANDNIKLGFVRMISDNEPAACPAPDGFYSKQETAGAEAQGGACQMSRSAESVRFDFFWERISRLERARSRHSSTHSHIQ